MIDTTAELQRMAGKFEPGDSIEFEVEHIGPDWYVAEMFEGARAQQWNFKSDEKSARAFCVKLNLQSESETTMDPDANLKELRELFDEKGRLLDEGDLDRATDLFKGLDRWLTNKGYLPKAWER